MTVITINGAGYPIKDIFSDAFCFNIPNYQRPYAWTTEETERLFDDLLDASDASNPNNIDINEIPPYFLGNIVLIKPLDKAESEVIDGQQRLTTLTILFAILKQLMPEHYKNDLNELICQPEKRLAGIPARPRLYLRERDRNFFQDHIQELQDIKKLENINLNNLSDSQENIILNAQFLLSKIQEYLPEESHQVRLVEFLLQRCYLVVVSTPEPDIECAYRIFSVLNDRGLDLSITDILKAEMIGKISQQIHNSDDRKNIENKYTKKWEDIEEKLGRDNFEELFSHLRMIFKKNRLQKKVIDEFRKHILNKMDLRDLIDAVLKPCADVLYEIKNCEFNHDISSFQEINFLCYFLNQISNHNWIPPAISYIQTYTNDPKEILLFFRHLERLAAGMMISKTNDKERTERYINILKAIENNEDLYSLNSPLQLTKGEKETIVKSLNNRLFYKNKSNIVKYIMLRLNAELSEDKNTYDSNKITIEHILPQNPNPDSQWIKLFPYEQERSQYTHCLGNLVLLSRQKNISAGNYDFEEKKSKYFNTPITPFAITVQVIQEKEWTPQVIEKRQKYLIGILKDLWKL